MSLEIPTLRGEPADKWYAKWLRDMKKLHGEHWGRDLPLTEEERRAWLKVHQLATRVVVARGRCPHKPKSKVIPSLFD